MTDHDTPLERAVELFVYAPIGLAMFAKDTVPTFMKMFVARGQTEVTQRRKTAGTQADQYKTIGQMAVKFGGPEVKRQAEAAATTVRKKAGETVAGLASATATSSAPTWTEPPSAGRNGTDTSKPTPKSTPKSTPKPTPAATTPTRTSAAPTPAVATPVVATPAADELAIPGYDTLSASQVIDRLTGLTSNDLAAVAAYETAHRGRTTILGKITQLTP